jgi:hypothetical protein
LENSDDNQILVIQQSPTSALRLWQMQNHLRPRLRKESRYWRDIPEIPTVEHFTSVVGALASSYAIGWLTAAV